MTVRRWIYVAIGIVVLLGIAILAWWTYRLYMKASRFEDMYYKCVTSPSDTVVVWKDRVVFSDDTLRPTPRKTYRRVDTVTITKDCGCDKLNYYADSYKKDGIRIRYELTTRGTLESLNFPNIIIPERYITVEKKVQIHDTITTNIEHSHVGIYGKLFVNSFERFPNFEAGAIYTIKGRGGVMGGVMYDVVTGKPYGTIGGFINLN
jgi:hypothetical protein